MDAGKRIALLAAVVVAAVVAFIIVKPGGDSGSSDSTTTSPGKPAQTPVHTVRGKGGKPVGGIQDLDFKKGDTIRFEVVSDVSDEIHVHGYDVKKDVAPGKPATFRFPGRDDGQFVVELESRGEQIANLKVTP
jgi:heme/copper-type cytochrome/quinol oxidase subunit 2